MTRSDANLSLVLFSDNAFKRKLAKLAIQALGVSVYEAASLAAARRAVFENLGLERCSAVVVALRDPEGDGVAAAQALRQQFDAARPEGDQPVIALVVERRDEALRRKAATAGVDYTMPEPVEWSALIDRLPVASDAPQSQRPQDEPRAADDEPALELTDVADAPTAREAELDRRFEQVEARRRAAARPAPSLQSDRGAEAEAIGPTRFLWRPFDGAFLVGPSAAEALGCAADAPPKQLEEWLSRCVAPRAEIVRAGMDVALRESGETLLVGAVQRDDGTRGQFALFAERLYDAQGRAVLSGAAHGVSAWSRETARDAATGLLTPEGLRPPMTEILKRAIGERRKCAAYALEIVDFFEIDDSFGVEAGSEAIAEIARRAAETLRAGDLIARIGRASFLIVQPEVKTMDDVRGLGARMIAALSEPVDILGAPTRLSVAMGAAIGPDHADTAPALGAAAETALKEALRKGATSLNLYGAIAHDPARERSTLRREVHTAVMSGAFELHYLPAVDAAGEVTCLEALLRLRRGDSWMSPEDVVDIAEQSGDVRRFMRRFFEMAAQDLAMWRHALGHAPKLAANLTGAALAEGRAVEEAALALEGVGLGVERLRIETTDKRLERRRAQAVIALAEAQHAGVEVALDEFGTRASSLEAVAAFPYDRVKIARGLVAQDRRRGGPDLFQAAAALGRDIGLAMTATGVSDAGLRARAAQLGCDEAQGYAIAPPARMSELVGWFSRARTAI